MIAAGWVDVTTVGRSKAHTWFLKARGLRRVGKPTTLIRKLWHVLGPPELDLGLLTLIRTMYEWPVIRTEPWPRSRSATRRRYTEMSAAAAKCTPLSKSAVTP